MATATFRIWRGEKGQGKFQDYTTEVSAGMVVLDAVHRRHGRLATRHRVRGLPPDVPGEIEDHAGNPVSFEPESERERAVGARAQADAGRPAARQPLDGGLLDQAVVQEPAHHPADRLARQPVILGELSAGDDWLGPDRPQDGPIVLPAQPGLWRWILPVSLPHRSHLRQARRPPG